MCQTQKLNYIAGVNFDACTNYSTHNVFPGKDWLSGEYCHFDKKHCSQNRQISLTNDSPNMRNQLLMYKMSI